MTATETETPVVDGTAAIGIRRHYTKPGEHPYTQVEWEFRDARIEHACTGEVAFEQNGVEVPSSWSVNATNIVAQKYFYGKRGTPQRETSVRQVIDRVVDTIADAGGELGYATLEGGSLVLVHPEPAGVATNTEDATR